MVYCLPCLFWNECGYEKKGYESFETVLNNGMRAINVTDFEAVVEETGALILDTRKTGISPGFIPQSINRN
jgi:hypothetical protein